MKRQKHLAGYTIIEVMMFLIVSSGLLVSTTAAVSGRQERIRFSQNTELFEQRIKDLLNDISTGYYPSANNIRCTSVGSVLTVTSAAAEKGTNTGCVFLGKAIQFGPGSQYNAYTMVASKNATSLADAGTRLLGVTPTPGLVENESINSDLQVTKIVSLTDTSRNVAGIALVSDFTKTSSVGSKVSGNAARVTLYEVPPSFTANAGTSAMNAGSQGVLLCLQQGSNGRVASLEINAYTQSLTTQLKLDENRDTRCA